MSYHFPTADPNQNQYQTAAQVFAADQYDRQIGCHGYRDLSKGPVVVLGGGRVDMVAETLKARGIDYRVVEKKPGIG